MAASSSSSPSPPAEDADGHCADYALFSDALRHFADRQHELDSSLKSSQRSLDLQFASHDALLKQCAAQWAEYARLQAMQRDLRAELSKEEKAAMRERLEEDQITMEMAKQELDMWRQAKPGNQSSIFLRIVLGRVNVQLWKKTDRIEFKDAYNRFKRDTTAIFLIFPRQHHSSTRSRTQHGDNAARLQHHAHCTRTLFSTPPTEPWPSLSCSLVLRCVYSLLSLCVVQWCSCCCLPIACCSSCTSCGCCTTTSRCRCARTSCTPTAAR